MIAPEIEVRDVGDVNARERRDIALVGLVDSSEHALQLIEQIVQEAACPERPTVQPARAGKNAAGLAVLGRGVVRSVADEAHGRAVVSHYTGGVILTPLGRQVTAVTGRATPLRQRLANGQLPAQPQLPR